MEIDQLNKEINELENELNKINEKLEELKIIIKEKEKKVNNERKIIQVLKRSLLNNNSNIYKIKELIGTIKKNIINDIKLNIPIDFKKGEKMISVIFISVDQNIYYSVICKNTDIFSNIKNKFYDKYPEYKNTKNVFIVNGNKVDILKSIDDNKIKNSDIITFKTFK